MPKISTKRLSYNTDKAQGFFDIDIYYSQKHRFYAVIPEAYREVYNHLSNRMEYHTETIKVPATPDCPKMIVTGATEEQALERATTLVTFLVGQQIVERKVILVWCGKDSSFRNDNQAANKEHQPVTVKLSMGYCTEITVHGGKPTYYRYTVLRGFNGREDTRKEELHIGYVKPTVLDDTPENRKFLESLYQGLTTLQEKLESITKDSTSLIDFIVTRQNLLNYVETK